MDNFGLIITSMLIYATPLIITAIGGLYSEKSGVINIGLEGMMTFGAFLSAIVAFFLVQYQILQPNFLVLIIAIIAGGLGGLVWAFLHAWLSINLKVDQVISGTVINILALALAVFLTNIIFSTKETYPISSQIPTYITIGEIDIYYVTIIVFIIVLITWYIFKYTKFGRYITTVGEDPNTADSVGINVKKVRYMAVLISGILAGIGGASVVLISSSRFAANVIAGKGFIALSVLIFGRYSTKGIVLAGLFFGITSAFGIIWPIIVPDSSIPSVIFLILPYLSTILALVIFSRNSVSPTALGTPYNKEVR